jgi:pimeloyl-ACP methyl ester carboxylesterase
MLHGAGIGHRTFDPQLDDFGGAYRLTLMDVRGHGESRPLARRFSMDDAVDDVLALLDEFGGQPAVLLGQSMGGNIAQEVVFKKPGHVSALIAADCVCNTLPLPFVQRMSIAATPALLRLLPERYLRSSTVGLSKQPAVQHYLADSLGRLSRDEIIDFTIGTLRVLHPDPDYHVPCPLLIIHGEDDSAGTIRQQAPVWARRDGAVYKVVPTAGHLSNMDNPAVFNEAVLAFLNGALDRGI